MIRIQNAVTEYIVLDKKNMYNIVTFIDIDEHWTDSELTPLFLKWIANNPILTHYIIEKEGICYWHQEPNPDLKQENFMKIVSTDSTQFDSYSKIMLNLTFPFKYKWMWVILNDVPHNKSRVYIKISHAYCDGYNLIDMIVNTLGSYKKPVFTRKVEQSFLKKIYYNVVGVLVLFTVHLKVLLKVFSKKSKVVESKMDVLKCKTLNLPRLKQKTKRLGVTLNDYLYALTVRTLHLYEKKSILSMTPINVSNKTSIYDTNNMHFILNEHELTNDVKTASNYFNLCKHTWFIPVTHKIITTLASIVPSSVNAFWCNKILNNVDMSFTNMIGPTFTEHPKLLKISNIVFFTMTNSNEICFNIISFGQKINVYISFKESKNLDKARFKQCFKQAYREL